MKELTCALEVPSDYDELLAYYTHKGYRVIGCATRHIKRLSWVKAQKMKRDDVERDLNFVGFIIFENKLKSSTASVLGELLNSNIGAVMVTGDNILTAISVARECNLIDKMAHCFVPHFAHGKRLKSLFRLINSDSLVTRKLSGPGSSNTMGEHRQ
jgi:cation-transporting P-type ATPase 13A2